MQITKIDIKHKSISRCLQISKPDIKLSTIHSAHTVNCIRGNSCVYPTAKLIVGDLHPLYTWYSSLSQYSGKLSLCKQESSGRPWERIWHIYNVFINTAQPAREPLPLTFLLVAAKKESHQRSIDYYTVYLGQEGLFVRISVWVAGYAGWGLQSAEVYWHNATELYLKHSKCTLFEQSFQIAVPVRPQASITTHTNRLFTSYERMYYYKVILGGGGGGESGL